MEQQEQLKKWTSERDAIVADLYLKKTENEKLISENKLLAQSNKELAEKDIQFKKNLSGESALLADIAKNRVENAKLLSVKDELNKSILNQQEQVQLKSWVSQRDDISLEISNLRTEKEKLEISNRDLAASNTEIQNKINQLTGRLAELDKVEKDYTDIVSTGFMETTIKKTQLESEVANLEKVIKILTPQKETLEKDVSLLFDVFNTMNNRIGVMDKVVTNVTRISERNSNEIETLVSKLKSSLTEIIDVNQKNVIATNQVLDKLPVMLVELQKHGLVRHRI